MIRRRLSVVVIAAVLLMAPTVAQAAVPTRPPGPTFGVAKVGPQDGGGEPSIASANTGELYVTYPASSGTPFFRSKDGGRSWTKGATADSASGDDCMTTDQSGALYLCNLAGNNDKAPLQSDVYKSTNDGGSWAQAAGVLPGVGASSQPFATDRPWADAYVPRGATTSRALAALMYHDFVPSQIWVNISTDGGKTFGAPTDVIAGSPEAQAYTFCNSVPAGTKIEKSGPHPGRIYVAWIAPDAPSSLATGCNFTMLDTFHTLWVAWSDDAGSTWTTQMAFDGGLGHDASTPFAAFTLDDQGNPYIAFADNLGREYDMYVVASFDGGKTWEGGNGPLGSLAGAGKPFKVNSDSGTHFFPTIAAGDPGHVDVAYLATPATISTLPNGKAAPGGGAGDSWYLEAAQTLNLRAAHPTWSVSRATPRPVHVGDICNLGIFCVGPSSNRDLLDFISVAVDPRTGLMHIAYTNDNATHEIDAANQVGGSSVLAR
jgi:hypothetical protein